MKPAKATGRARLVRSITPAEADAFMASDLVEIVPAIVRQDARLAIALAHTDATCAAAGLAWLRHAGPNVQGRFEKVAEVREFLRAASAAVEEEWRAMQAEPIRMARAAS